MTFNNFEPILDPRVPNSPKSGYTMEFQLPAPPPGMGGPNEQQQQDQSFLQALTGPEELQSQLPHGPGPFGPGPFGPAGLHPHGPPMG